MINGIVLNHHSLPFANTEAANQGVLLFFKILKTCRAVGLKVLLLDEDQDKSLMSLELSNSYFVRDWFNAAKNDASLRDWRSFLRSVETKQPLFETVELMAMDNTLEVGLLGDNIGNNVLLATYYFETFLVSFATSAPWLNHKIDIWVLDLVQKTEEEQTSLPNLVDDVSLAKHKTALLERRNQLINSAKDIWGNRLELFPNLTLLPNQIGTALQNWSARSDILLKARDALNVLEQFSAKWKNAEYKDYRHNYLHDLGLAAKVSGESKSVNADPKKKKQRMFWLDDGREVYCENHIKLPNGFRLHFYPDSSKKHIYVVYLGTHLLL